MKSTGMVAVICCCLVALALATEPVMPGGPEDITDLSKIPPEVIKKGKEHLASLANGACLQNAKVDSAKKQVVSGTNYMVIFSSDLSSCGNGQGIQKCTVTIWYQPWLDSVKVTDVKC